MRRLPVAQWHLLPGRSIWIYNGEEASTSFRYASATMNFKRFARDDTRPIRKIFSLQNSHRTKFIYTRNEFLIKFKRSNRRELIKILCKIRLNDVTR